MTHKGPQALDIKSATIYTVRLVLYSADTTELLDALHQRMQGAGAFFENEPVVIDSTAIHDEIDWQAIIQALQQYQLHPIGMMGNPEHQAAATQLQLPVVEISSAKVVIEIPEPPQEALEPTPIITAPPLIHNQPLRSGQRCFAPDGDLIIMGMVAHGAEIIAAGNIYVHGPLRGKAIAGANGNTNAFILATEFEPELIAIAGVYSVIEDSNAHPHHKKSVLIQLDNESLKFTSLG